jgi:HK97 family phage major capsid protein
MPTNPGKESNMSKNYSEIIRSSRETFNKTQINLRKAHPAAWNKVAADGGLPEHPADMRREANQCTHYYNEILAKSKGREMTEEEFGALECLNALSDLLTATADLQHDSENNFAATDGLGGLNSKKLFNKGEKMALDFRPEHLQDVSIGVIMAAMLGIDNAKRSPSIQNALSVGTDSLGGYTVPTELLREFIDVLRAKSVLFQAGARTLALDMMKTNLTTVISDPVPGWRLENAPVSESDMNLGNVQFQPTD